MNKNIVVIGGGTGSFTVLSGVKQIPNTHITAIVASTDSGGSTGRLRDEFGYLPVGDIRQCLVALAENKEEQKILRDLFSYRFDKGETGLRGHNFGNLFMTALRDIIDDELKAIEYIQKLLNIQGNVLPVTLEDCNLVAMYENGMKLSGEANIDEPEYPHDGNLHITQLSIEPYAKTYDKVIDAIVSADVIIGGPGDLYTSILANFVIGGVTDALHKSRARFIYISNLVTKFGQTAKFTLADHVREVEHYALKKIDTILVNNAPLPQDILQKYALENAYPVANDMKDDNRVVLLDLLASDTIKTSSGDTLKRSLIRHDSKKISDIIATYL